MKIIYLNTNQHASWPHPKLVMDHALVSRHAPTAAFLDKLLNKIVKNAKLYADAKLRLDNHTEHPNRHSIYQQMRKCVGRYVVDTDTLITGLKDRGITDQDDNVNKLIKTMIRNEILRIKSEKSHRKSESTARQATERMRSSEDYIRESVAMAVSETSVSEAEATRLRSETMLLLAERAIVKFCRIAYAAETAVRNAEDALYGIIRRSQ